MRPARGLLHLAQHREFLLVFQGGVLAHGAQKDHPVNAGLDHGFQVVRGGVQV